MSEHVIREFSASGFTLQASALKPNRLASLLHPRRRSGCAGLQVLGRGLPNLSFACRMFAYK